LAVKAQPAFLWKSAPSIGRKSVKACFYICIYNRHIKTRAYSTATLCPNCKAIGEQLSEIYAFEHDLRFCTNGHLHFYLYRCRLYRLCISCVGLSTLPPSVSRLARHCGILNNSQPYWPPQTYGNSCKEIRYADVDGTWCSGWSPVKTMMFVRVARKPRNVLTECL
jgi:hypothetical protein